MLMDTNKLPNKCPNEKCNASWSQGNSKMIAVALKDCIQIECTECGHVFVKKNK